MGREDRNFSPSGDLKTIVLHQKGMLVIFTFLCWGPFFVQLYIKTVSFTCLEFVIILFPVLVQECQMSGLQNCDRINACYFKPPNGLFVIYYSIPVPSPSPLPPRRQFTQISSNSPSQGDPCIPLSVLLLTSLLWSCRLQSGYSLLYI